MKSITIITQVLRAFHNTYFSIGRSNDEGQKEVFKAFKNLQILYSLYEFCFRILENIFNVFKKT